MRTVASPAADAHRRANSTAAAVAIPVFTHSPPRAPMEAFVSSAPAAAAATPSPSASPTELIKAKDAIGFFFLLAAFVAVLALFYVWDRRRTRQQQALNGEPLLE